MKNHLESLLLPYQQKYFDTIETYKRECRSLEKSSDSFQQQKIKKNLIQIQDFFFESLENQLKSTQIFPETLPKLTSAIIFSNKMIIKDIYLEKNLIADYLLKLKEMSLLTGEPIREIIIPTISIITVSFFHKEEVDSLLNFQRINENIDNFRENLLKMDGSEEYIVKNQDKFKFETLDHGDYIVVFGDIKFKNDYQSECITYDFKENSIWDYFSCADCKIKCEFCLF